LHKLHVELEGALGQLLHLDALADLLPVESCLEALEVVEVVHLCLCSHLDLGHLHRPWVDGVEDLAVDDAAGEVLDLRRAGGQTLWRGEAGVEHTRRGGRRLLEARLEVVADPLRELFAANKVALVHDA